MLEKLEETNPDVKKVRCNQAVLSECNQNPDKHPPPPLLSPTGPTFPDIDCLPAASLFPASSQSSWATWRRARPTLQLWGFNQLTNDRVEGGAGREQGKQAEEG